THTLSLPTTFTYTATGPTLTFSGATTVSGPGTLVSQGTLILSGDTIDAPLTNQGSLIAAPSTNAITGTFTNDTAGTLTIRAGPNAASTLTVATGFTNAGSIVLTQQSCCNAGAA